MFTRQLRRFTRTHRQFVAAILAGTAALLTISMLRPSPPPTTPILVASRPLPAGHTVSDADVRTADWPTVLGEPLTTADLGQVKGRITAGPLSTGEPITATRIVGPGLLGLAESTSADGQSGTYVAAPVRLADAGQTALIRPGDLVDVLAARATDGGGQSAEQVAADARVITIASQSEGEAGLLPRTGNQDGDSTEPGSLIVLAVSAHTATELAAAATRSRLSIVLKPPTRGTE